MDIEKKGALRNIMRGLFVSERQGDVVSSISVRDLSTLFSKSYEYEEYVEQPIVEEVPGVSRNTVQNRYSKIGKTRRLEKVANDILKTLLDLRTFENNKRDYEDSLRNYHSIVEARRHKEIMEVFQKEINNETFSPKRIEKSKSSKPLLLGGLALGAVALLLPLKSFAKEMEDELNEKDLNKQIDDLNSSLNLEELERQFSEFDDLPDEIPDQEETRDEKLKLDNDIEKATNEIEKLQSDIDKTEIAAKEELGTSRAGTTSTTRFRSGRVRPDETPILDETKVTDTARASSRQVTPLTSASEDLASTKVSGGLDEDRRMAIMAPTDVTDTSRASNRAAPLPSNEQIVTGTSRASSSQVTPFMETGTSRATNIAAPLPSNEQSQTSTAVAGSATGTAVSGSAFGISTATNRQVSATTETGSTQVTSRNRVGFARLRPDESAIAEVSPNIVFGGFPYSPNNIPSPRITPDVPVVAPVPATSFVSTVPRTGAVGTATRISEPAIKPDKTDEKTIIKIIDSGPGFIIIQMSDGKIVKRTGTLNSRQNNPGNIEYGPWTLSLGALPFPEHLQKIFDDAVKSKPRKIPPQYARFAVFPTYEMGRKAKEKLLFEQKKSTHKLGPYSELTVEDAIKKFAPPEEKANATEAYTANVKKSILESNLGLNEEQINKMKMKEYNQKQRKVILDAMELVEGGRNSTFITEQLKESDVQKLITNNLITEEERRTINLRTEKTTSDVKPQTSTGQRVGSSSSQNRDSKRQAQQSRPAVVIQNNNNTVINNRNTVNNVSAPRQQNNNPNMRQ